MVVSSSSNSPSKKINQPSKPFLNVGTSSLTSSGSQKKSMIKLSDNPQHHNMSPSKTPTNGGLWYDAHNKEPVPFVGFDPDVKMNSFAYDETLKEYTLIGDFCDSNLQILKGPSHVGQLRPAGVKTSAKTMERCTTLSKPVIHNGVTATTTDGETVKHRTWVEIMQREVID
jgi:hypothetical protein